MRRLASVHERLVATSKKGMNFGKRFGGLKFWLAVSMFALGSSYGSGGVGASIDGWVGVLIMLFFITENEMEKRRKPEV